MILINNFLCLLLNILIAGIFFTKIYAMQDIDTAQKCTISGISPLFITATQQGDEETMRSLLKMHDIDLNAIRLRDGSTLLIEAVFCGRLGIIELLLRDGRVGVNASGDEGFTALIKAIYIAYVPVIELLLTDARINLNQANEYGLTPLMVAAQQGQTTILELLLRDERTHINTLNELGKNALILAIEHHHLSIASRLLEGGALDHEDKALSLARSYQMIDPQWIEIGDMITSLYLVKSAIKN